MCLLVSPKSLPISSLANRKGREHSSWFVFDYPSALDCKQLNGFCIPQHARAHRTFTWSISASMRNCGQGDLCHSVCGVHRNLNSQSFRNATFQDSQIDLSLSIKECISCFSILFHVSLVVMDWKWLSQYCDAFQENLIDLLFTSAIWRFWLAHHKANKR